MLVPRGDPHKADAHAKDVNLPMNRLEIRPNHLTGHHDRLVAGRADPYTEVLIEP
jgi:hypothetical protein